jgi:hypothetical protein
MSQQSAGQAARRAALFAGVLPTAATVRQWPTGTGETPETKGSGLPVRHGGDHTADRNLVYAPLSWTPLSVFIEPHHLAVLAGGDARHIHMTRE